MRVGLVIFGSAINRKICHFDHITSGLGKKINSNSGLFECQFHEIEVNASTGGNGPASSIILTLTKTHNFFNTINYRSNINNAFCPFFAKFVTL